MALKVGNWLIGLAFGIGILFLTEQDAWLGRHRPSVATGQFTNHLVVHFAGPSLRHVFVSQHDLYIRWTIVTAVVLMFLAGVIIKRNTGR